MYYNILTYRALNNEESFNIEELRSKSSSSFAIVTLKKIEELINSQSLNQENLERLLKVTNVIEKRYFRKVSNLNFFLK